MRWTVPVAVAIAAGLACSPFHFEWPALRAFGNEPFWNVTIPVSDSIVYGRMGEANVSFPYEPSDYVEGDSALVLGPLRDPSDEHEITIRITAEDCQDTMADVVHPMRARVVIDGEELFGCARYLEKTSSGER
ncbi:MAG: hypothetical protein HKP01_01310 [Gemmatimonadetes bacterium]|nr:hypothetical protein [Gemmatimonadota bacterium]